MEMLGRGKVGICCVHEVQFKDERSRMIANGKEKHKIWWKEESGGGGETEGSG